MNTNLVSYYKDRAKEYEKIYSKPERQDDFQAAKQILQEQFANKNVLEIACGTGYWTEAIAKTATTIFATDINQAVIEIAEQKDFSKSQVTFSVADIFNFHPNKKYESLFAGFILSHILLQDLDRFLNTINQFVLPNATVVIMDNTFVEGSNLPITNTDEHGNTFQTRKLDDGTTHLVLKNFPTENYLQQKLSTIATDIQFINLKYYWILSYRTLDIQQ
jgi:demethylmenaquinone methyltransferase/2-methoxy-6-polyprenyl-1,4-benzoquinol methylase